MVGLLLRAFVVMAALGFPLSAPAQQFPSRVIRIVVGSDQSAPSDIISRLVAAELAESEGWRVVIENRPGATYTISAAEVLKQPANGYTIWALALPASVAPALLPNLAINIDAEFTGLIKLTTSRNVLVVHPSVPAHSMSELIAYVGRNPGKLTFSSGGFGTPAHLIGEIFKKRAGLQVSHVPYPGAMSRAVTDLLNGTNQYQFITTLPVVELIADGRLRALAVTGSERVAALKDVPTVVEQGHPDLVVEDWTGLAVKAGTPTEIMTKLNAALNKALAKPKIRQALEKIGAEPAGGTANEFDQLLKAQTVYWKQVITTAGITIER